jgi:hypothetical protein
MSDFFKTKTFSNSKKNYNLNSFPLNRKEQFKKIFFSRFNKLLSVNIVSFLFWIPYIAWDLICKTSKSNIDNVVSLNQFVITIELPIKIITSLIAFIGLAGTIYYVRKILWGEPVSLFRTFFKGIKESYKQFLFFGFFFGVLTSFFELAINVIRLSSYSSEYIILFIALLLIGAIFAFSALSYALTMSSLYYMKLTTIIKYSLMLTLKKILLNTIFSLITYGVFFLLFGSGNIYLYFVGIIVMGLIWISFTSLIWVTFTNSSYDIYINYKQYPSFYRKGLRHLKEETNNA